MKKHDIFGDLHTDRVFDGLVGHPGVPRMAVRAILNSTRHLFHHSTLPVGLTQPLFLSCSYQQPLLLGVLAARYPSVLGFHTGPTFVSILQMKVRFRKRKAEPNLEMCLSSSALEQFASTPASYSLVHLFIICLPSLSSLRVGPLSCAHRCIPRNWLNACL